MVLLAVLGARAMVAELQPALGGDDYMRCTTRNTAPCIIHLLGRVGLLARATMC
jgi:hypothetical protein